MSKIVTANLALYILISLLLFSFSVQDVSAQCMVGGHVYNKGGAVIEGATIRILSRQDSILAQTITDSLGRYFLSKLPSGSLTVKATALGCKADSKYVMLFKGTAMNVDFTLMSDAIQLEEVKVNGRGIIANGDTTTYITRKFTTGQEQTLGDVLETLPGFKVDKENSTVEANGKPVTRILMEKQDLFQGNNSVPLNNVPGQDVTSIDVIENYSDYNILEGFKTSNETVISVNMSDKKKGRLSGQADVRAGIDNKYSLKNYSMLIKKKVMFSAIASANNTGKALLNQKDIIGMNGGLSELLSGEDSQAKIARVFNESSSLIGDREDAYKRDNGIVSLNTVFMPSGKVKVLWNSIVGLDRYRMNSTTHYSYLNVPLAYDISNQSKNYGVNVNSNLKLQLMPSQTFNIFYTGKVLLSHYSRNGNGEFMSHFTDDDNSRTIDLENNILAIKKINKKNTLNISATYNYFRNRANEDFSADSAFYGGYRDLDDSFGYTNRMSWQNAGAEVFLLLRFNDDYYTRIGLRSYIDQENILTDLSQQTMNTAFDNDDYIRHYDNSLDLQLRKDHGKLQFAAKAKLTYLKFETNVRRTLTKMNRLVVVPSLDVKYGFNNFHSLTLNYSDVVNTYGIRSLFSNLIIDNYRMFHSSSVGSTFGYYHTASLIHQFMKPLYGFTLVDAVSFTYSADDVLNDNLLNGIVREANYITSSSGTSSLAVTSYVDKKFRSFPLDLSVTLSYNHGNTPYYMEGNIIHSQSDSYNFFGSASTFRKKGLNFKATGNYSITEMRGDGNKYKVKNENYLAQLSYTLPKLYLEVGGRYRVVRLEESKNDNLYCNFQVRYDLSKKLQISITGQDVFHLSKKTSADVTINNYLSTYSTIRYMPGHVLLGLAIKY